MNKVNWTAWTGEVMWIKVMGVSLPAALCSFCCRWAPHPESLLLSSSVTFQWFFFTAAWSEAFGSPLCHKCMRPIKAAPLIMRALGMKPGTSMVSRLPCGMCRKAITEPRTQAHITTGSTDVVDPMAGKRAWMRAWVRGSVDSNNLIMWL